MSRFLRGRRIAVLGLSVAAIGGVESLLLLMLPMALPYIALVNTAIVLLSLLDVAAYKRMLSQRDPFSAKSTVRNVDCLIIGKPCCAGRVLQDNMRSFVQVKLPMASVLSCYEVLRRTHSIVRPGGMIVLIVSSHHASREVLSPFDAVMMHDVTIDKYGIQNVRKASRVIGFLHPIKSLELLFDGALVSPRQVEISFARISEMRQFCHERELSLRIYEA